MLVTEFLGAKNVSLKDISLNRKGELIFRENQINQPIKTIYFRIYYMHCIILLHVLLHILLEILFYTVDIFEDITIGRI